MEVGAVTRTGCGRWTGNRKFIWSGLTQKVIVSRQALRPENVFSDHDVMRVEQTVAMVFIARGLDITKHSSAY